MGFLARLLGFGWRRWADYQSVVAILDVLDLKTGLGGLFGAVTMMFIAATNMDWSVPTILLVALLAGALVSMTMAAIRIVLRLKTPPLGVPKQRQFPTEVSAVRPMPDLDPREAYFQILEFSEWRKEQDRTTDPTQLVYDWREVRLSGEIHKALRNSRLDSWGEECLPGTATTPEKPIPPDAWDRMEIAFDRAAFPRTAAHFKGRTSRELGPMAWVGVKFSKDQIFGLFPLETGKASIDRIPVTDLLKMATDRGWDFLGHDSLHLLDMQDAIRQGASDNHIAVWGRLKRWSTESLLRNEILEKIPPEHWRTFYVHLWPAREGDNFHTKSWTPSETPQNYLDLHVDRREAADWLSRDAAPFRGKRKPHQRGTP